LLKNIKQDMAKRKSTAPKATAAVTEKDPEMQIENALGQTEMWLEKNWKQIAIAIAAVLIVIGGIYGYKEFIQAPQGRKAADAMFVAEQHYIAGEYNTALEGDGTNLGFVDVVATYGGTAQGRLAAHYAGICFLKEGDYDSALEFLSKYKPVRGVPGTIINAENEGLKGDAYVQKSDYAAAAGHFRKAADTADNILTTPMYLKKLGLALEAAGDYAGAVEAYKEVSDKYSTSLEARDIEKFAAEAQQKL
jgi:tetratricopeptide (TPR) repeat protein